MTSCGINNEEQEFANTHHCNLRLCKTTQEINKAVSNFKVDKSCGLSEVCNQSSKVQCYTQRKTKKIVKAVITQGITLYYYLRPMKEVKRKLHNAEPHIHRQEIQCEHHREQSFSLTKANQEIQFTLNSRCMLCGLQAALCG